MAIVAELRIHVLRSHMPGIMGAAGSTDIVTRGLCVQWACITDTGVLLELELAAKAGHCVATCTWLVYLAGPCLLESALLCITLIQALCNKILGCIAHSANLSFAQRNSGMVRIQTLCITYTITILEHIVTFCQRFLCSQATIV